MLFSHFWIVLLETQMCFSELFPLPVGHSSDIGPKEAVKGGRASKLAVDLFSGPSSGTLFE